LDNGIAIAAEIGVAQVIGEDEDDVRALDGLTIDDQGFDKK
jgi:hypothetical protein